MLPTLQILFTLLLTKKQASDFHYMMVEMKMFQIDIKKKSPNGKGLKTLHCLRKKRARDDSILCTDWNQNTKPMSGSVIEIISFQIKFACGIR